MQDQGRVPDSEARERTSRRSNMLAGCADACRLRNSRGTFFRRATRFARFDFGCAARCVQKIHSLPEGILDKLVRCPSGSN